jgi:predicted permease
MSTLINDIKYGFRQLYKSPGFTIVAVLTLALGIGANTAVFSLINSVLIKPLPYPDSERLVRVFETFPNGRRNGSVSGGAFKDWYKYSSQFAHMAIYENRPGNLTGEGMPQHVFGFQVSSEFLSVLGVTPMLGRDFMAGEDAVGGNNNVIILTHQLWRNRYGSDPDILGKTVLLDQIPYTIVGVLGCGALFQDDVLFLIPTVIDGEGTNWKRTGHWRHVIGRLSPSTTLSKAQAELRGIKQQLAAEYSPFRKQDWSVALVPMQDVYAGKIRQTLMILLGTVAFVLLIACANVSNLLLSRGSARSREMAIRTALGARPLGIIRQMLIESLLLALAGCAVGLLFSIYGITSLTYMIAGIMPVPHLLYPRLDINVLLFTICTSCACSILFGILPALRASRTDLNHDLKEAERGSTSAAKRRSQSFLVISEFAFTLVLLVGAGLLLRSFVHLFNTDPGFDPRQKLAFDLSLPDTKYPTDADRLRFTKDLIGRIDDLPGVEAVGTICSLPFGKGGWTDGTRRMDQPEKMMPFAGTDFVSGDYFSAMGIKLLRGRVFTETDNTAEAHRVAVIDSGVAYGLYPDEDPIGRHIDLCGQSCEIVGIVTPVRHSRLGDDPQPRVYGTQAQLFRPASIVIRTSLPPLSLVETIRRTVLEVDPDQPITNIRTLEVAVHNSLASQRNMLILLGFFAAVAVGLACIGIYGFMSCFVGQRTRELCIRAALGAQRHDIIRMVVGVGIRLSIIGISIGLIASLALARFLESQLFEIKTYDPPVYVVSICLISIMALFSVYLPARRVAKIDPMETLRYE